MPALIDWLLIARDSVAKSSQGYFKIFCGDKECEFKEGKIFVQPRIFRQSSLIAKTAKQLR